MFRFVRNFFLVTLLAAAVAAAWVISRSTDALYTVEEWLGYTRYRRYDELIVELGRKHSVDPLLIKAIVWRESAFHSEKIGQDGERGLMQVTVGAASDWARQTKVEDFMPTDLFAPRTNLEAGTWYIKQALTRWAEKDEPMTFALAEYNAGLSRVQKWIGTSNMGDRATAADLRDNISFPGTKSYVDAILARYRFYKERGRL